MLGGFSATSIALITYSIRRMSVSRAFAYSYLLLYAVAAIPGFLFICIAMTAGVMRPERDPALQQWLYDFGFLSFSGTMGVFLVGSLIWMAAILLDENGVFPKWFGYLNLCNALTEVVIAPSWIFQRGVLAWNGVIAWWIDVVVFGMYTGVFIYLLRNLIQRDDLGDGPVPSLAARRASPDPPARQGHPLVTITEAAPPPDAPTEDVERIPGEPDMWVFVLFESLVFTSYFCVYLYFRTQDEAAFLEAQSALTLPLGILDTILLLTSSWAMARCVLHARAGQHRVAQQFAYRHRRPRRRLPRAQGGRVGVADRRRPHLHQQRVHAVLLLPHRHARDPPADRLRRARRARPPARRPAATLADDDRDLHHLLAHRRPLLGDHLRPALRGEVTVETSSKKRLNVAWLVVVAITVIYLWIDHTADDGGVLDGQHRRDRVGDRPRPREVPDRHARVHGRPARAAACCVD